MVIEEIAANLYRLEIPLSTGSLESTNSYVIKGPERSLIIDPGAEHKECLRTMVSALDKLGVDLEKSDFFITHGHGDHYGLLWQLTREGSTVFASRKEADVMNGISTAPMLENFPQFIKVSGFPESDINIILPPNVRKKRIREALAFRVIEDGEFINIGDYRFICVYTPGHSNGHMCLYEPNLKLLISGDHILGTISPGVLYRFNNGNPLECYLESLDKINKLDITIVLPGHRKVFNNCRERIIELKGHVENRCQEILSILQEDGKNAYQTASQMTWNGGGEALRSLPIFHQFLATGKTAAYLAYLEELRRLKKEMKEGEWVYSYAV